MTEQVQSRRGTTAQHSTFAGAVGEVTVDTDKDVPVIHDGATLGGFPSPGLKVPQTWTGAQAFTDASFTNAPTGAGITALFATLPGPVGTSGSAQAVRGTTVTATTAFRGTDVGTGSSSSLLLTTTGGTQAEAFDTAASISWLRLTGHASTFPAMGAAGSGSNIAVIISSKGGSSVYINTNNGGTPSGGSIQAEFIHAASASNHITFTGSNGGNPILGVSGGSLAVTPAIVAGSAAVTISDAVGLLGLKSYTVGTLPTASPAGRMVYVSDGTSNKRQAVSDATNWRWPDGAIVS